MSQWMCLHEGETLWVELPDAQRVVLAGFDPRRAQLEGDGRVFVDPQGMGPVTASGADVAVVRYVQGGLELRLAGCRLPSLGGEGYYVLILREADDEREAHHPLPAGMARRLFELLCGQVLRADSPRISTAGHPR